MPSMITSENENFIRITSHPEAILSHPSSVVHAKLYQESAIYRRLFSFILLSPGIGQTSAQANRQPYGIV